MLVFIILVGLTAYIDCIAASAGNETNASSVISQDSPHADKGNRNVQRPSPDNKSDVGSRTGRRRMTDAEREVLKKELREAMEKAYSSEN